jgi:predicted peptidase
MMNTVLLLAYLVIAGAALPAWARAEVQPTGQQAHVLENEQGMDLDYLLYLPPTYADADDPWPLMLFLHGAGERGDDVRLVAKHGPPKLVAEGTTDLPFVIVSPQCPTNGWWAGAPQLNALEALLDHVGKQYRIDEDRIYVTGLSMGGFGTWGLAAAWPERFAALAPICGGGDPATVERFAHVPTWVFHGARDRVVGLEASAKMVAAMRAAGADVQFTVYPEAGHDSWTETYANPRLYRWFLSHRRGKGKD